MKNKPSDMLMEQNKDYPLKDNLDGHEIHEDLQLLIYTLENRYGGRKFIDQSIIKKVIEDLKSIDVKNYSLRKLCDDIGKILLQIPDNHMVAKTNGKWCGGKSWLTKANVGACESFQHLRQIRKLRAYV